MKKITFLLLTSLSFCSLAQSGYEIKVNFKNCKDTAFYLARYYFGQSLIVDSCKNVKKGSGVFKSKTKIESGVYIIANQSKERYIDFLLNENRKLTVDGDFSDLINTLKSPDSKENEDLCSYAKVFTAKNQQLQKAIETAKGKSKADSIKLVNESQRVIADELKKYDEEFMKNHKGTFVYDFLNLRTEKFPTDVPLAKNGRPDSIYQYYYYKNHYFDGVDFKDERILFTPFLADRINKYFETVIVQHPDTAIKEIDKIFARCTEGNLVYNRLLGHFCYKYETNKTMTFDKFGKTNTFEKVFVHLSDKYIIPGKVSGVYDDETVEKIKNRVNIIRNLLPEAKVADLFMIDTIYGKQVLKMGFDTANTSKSASDLYAKTADKIKPLYKTLYNVNSKYTLLVFWSVDCGHCQKEIPELNKNLKAIKNKIDLTVFAVQTKSDLYDKWRQFIIEHELDFVNVFEPVHLNNLTERFDINRTPVIYLLDKDKKIKGKNLSADQVIEILNNLETKETQTN